MCLITILLITFLFRPFSLRNKLFYFFVSHFFGPIEVAVDVVNARPYTLLILILCFGIYLIPLLVKK